MTRALLSMGMLLVLFVLPVTAAAQQAAVAVRTLAERRVAQLPAGPLHWRLELFPSRAAAEAAAGTTGVVAELGGKVYLSVLGPAGASAGGTRVAELGPVATPAAGEVLLRVSELTGPPGSQAAVHTHPGAELYYVLAGELSVRSATGTSRAATGQALMGPPGGTAMQPASTGSVPVQALVFFAVDAAKPFSSSATLPAAATPVQVPAALPKAGGPSSVLLVGAAGAGGLLLMVGRRLRR